MTTKESLVLERNKHILSETVRQDIADTQAEINQMEKEIKAFRILGDRWSVMRADVREETRIPERKEFIKKLEYLLALREEQKI